MNQTAEINRVKNFGAVYTPQYIIDIMLELIGYKNNNIIGKHILENSFGDGAFLKNIVKKYCDVFISLYGPKPDVLKQHLETYIHGIEINHDEYLKCIESLDTIVMEYNIFNVVWDLYNEDTLHFNKFDGIMDYVIGNPPYVRVHNLNRAEVKKLTFTKTGMTDLYIAFYEIGLKQLNKYGKLCYITPSSFFTSKSGIALRNYIELNHSLSDIIDLGKVQVFENIMSYTAIALFQNNKYFNNINYVDYETKTSHRLPYASVFQSGFMYFNDLETLDFISIINNTHNDIADNNYIIVKNGYATLADKIFINDNINDEDIVLPVLKASTGKWSKLIFPYDKNGNPYSEEYIKNKYPYIYFYLNSHREKLTNRSLEKRSKWFLFGRSQGIKDTFKQKIAINNMIKDLKSIKLNKVSQGHGVYSGLYILTSYKYDDVYNAVYNNDFIIYLKSLKKYKSGGYYTFSSKDLEKYLKYKLQNII